MPVFSRITDHPDDPIESHYLRSLEDEREAVLNLGIGVYRDETGQAPLFESVRIAEQNLAQRAESKSYSTPFGHQGYIEVTEKLILGSDHAVLKNRRIISAQSPGAGGGLRIGAELLRSLNPDTHVWFSDPVWEHQMDFFSRAGLEVRRYRYYDSHRQQLDFSGMLESLDRARPGDLVVLHGCCHNPTGADLSWHHWSQLADFFRQRDLVPFIDIAYQGYGDGIETDVLGLQCMADHLDEMLITVSSSKSFAVYRDRAGLFSLIHGSDHPDPASLKRYLRDTIRGTYFMPPEHGAAVIAEIFMDEQLIQKWRQEIDGIRTRIRSCRAALADALGAIEPDMQTAYLREQHGMFSCLPLDASQLTRLEQEHCIYLLPGGRINFAAMNEDQAERIAQAIVAVL